MDRRIISAKRDRTGKIVALCNPAEGWSPRRIADVVRDIARGERSYYVQEIERRRYLRVVGGSLQTTSEKMHPNSLERLPNT